MVSKHILTQEFPEYETKISNLKVENAHFKKLFHEFDELDHEIYRIESDSEPASDEALNDLRKKKISIVHEGNTIEIYNNTNKKLPVKHINRMIYEVLEGDNGVAVSCLGFNKILTNLKYIIKNKEIILFKTVILFSYKYGAGGIRTPGALRLNSFQDCHLNPLGHRS